MTKYEVRFDPEFKTYTVLELITDDGAGNRFWEIAGEFDTEYEACEVMRDLIRIDEQTIYHEFG